jgi:hypothetical protein
MKNFASLLVLTMSVACSHHSASVENTVLQQVAVASSRAPASSQNSILGSGSVVEQIQEINFGKDRSKRFCDGKETSFIKSYMAKRCCTLRITYTLHSSLSIYLSPQERTLSINENDHAHGKYHVELSGKNLRGLQVDCGTPATVSDFENVFGGIFKVKEVKPYIIKNTNYLEEDSNLNQTPVGI